MLKETNVQICSKNISITVFRKNKIEARPPNILGERGPLMCVSVQDQIPPNVNKEITLEWLSMMALQDGMLLFLYIMYVLFIACSTSLLVST